MEAAKVRKPNWTEKERLVLVEAVRHREDRLFGKMKGPGGTKHNKVKEIAWEEVAQSVNAQSCTTSRTVEEIKKQYANIKQRAKEKADALRRPATGGGPKPPSPSPVEAEFLSGMGDRPTLSGLASGYDTEEVRIELIPEFSNSNIVPSTSNNTDTVCNNPAPVSYQLIDLPVAAVTTGQKTSKRRKTIEDEEILTLRAEREKYIQESEFYRAKTKYINLKIKQLEKSAHDFEQ